MTEPTPVDYSNEPDNEPDTIVELESLDESGPLDLSETQEDTDEWPTPPEDWEHEAHDGEYRADPDIVIEGPGPRGAYINGFSVSSSPSYIGIRSYRVPGTGTYLPVRSEIAPLLIGLASEFNRYIEPLHTGWCWGYSYRAQVGGSSYSFHSAGIAIDLNAPLHPYGRRYTFSAADRDRCRAVARKYGCRWGGDYQSNADEMHFEIIVSRSTALSLVKRIQSPTLVRRDVYFNKLNPGVTNSQSVKYLQRELNRRLNWDQPLTVDGDYGKRTKYAVSRWETKQGWDADGNVGKTGCARLFRDHGDIDYTIHW